MRTACMSPHWAVVATLSVLTIAGCRATVAPTASGVSAAGTGAPVESAGAGKTAMGAPTKTGTGTNAGSGNAATAAGSGSANTGAAGEAASGTSTGTSPQSTAKAGTGGSDATASEAGTSGGGGAAAPMKPKNPNAIPACEGKNNEGACDGAKLYFCIDEAPDGGGQSCMSAAMCQVGLKTGKCGVCEPGKFQCDKAELQKCDDTGQWALNDTCDSEALCKETKGLCDKSICTEGEYKCTGDDLQVCNKDLTALTTEMQCMKGLCNADAKKCNQCDPMVEKSCESSSGLTLCSKDGIKTNMQCPANKKYCVMEKKDCFECMTDQDCGMSMNECGTRACKDNTCVDGTPKQLGTKCSRAAGGGPGVCSLGSCVTCITDADCNNNQLRCFAGVSCVNKNAIEALPLLTTYTVNITPGYDVEISGSPSAGYNWFPGVGNKISSTMQTQSFTVGYMGATRVSGCSAGGILGLPTLVGNRVVLPFGKDVTTPAGMDPPLFPACETIATLTLTATAK